MAYVIASGHKEMNLNLGQCMVAWIMLALAMREIVPIAFSATPF
jgi:hypothetical protein